MTNGKKHVGPSKLYQSRTDKFEKTGHQFANCEFNDCGKAAAWRCEQNHYICAACAVHDPTVKKMGRKCPICDGHIVEKIQGI